MKRLFKSVILFLIVIPAYVLADGNGKQVYCKFGCPKGSPETDKLIQHNCYTLMNNSNTKFADWVAYNLDKKSITGNAKLIRIWKVDPLLSKDETLEPKDYLGANTALKVDRGHQAPLASFKGTNCWQETNYLSNITPQKSELNQGPWERVEDKERTLAESDTVYSITGTLYEREMPKLPRTKKPHEIPSGYWKIILIVPKDEFSSIKVLAFIFDQETPRNDDILNHLCSVDDIEAKTHLDFFPELFAPISKE